MNVFCSKYFLSLSLISHLASVFIQKPSVGLISFVFGGSSFHSSHSFKYYSSSDLCFGSEISSIYSFIISENSFDSIAFVKPLISAFDIVKFLSPASGTGYYLWKGSSGWNLLPRGAGSSCGVSD